MYIEIRSHPREMLFLGSHKTRPKKAEIEKAVLDEGFVAYGYDIWFAPLQKLWRFGGHIRRRKTASTTNTNVIYKGDLLRMMQQPKKETINEN